MGLHFLTSEHVVHPFKYPNYYGEDWLLHLTPETVAADFQLRDSAGNVMYEAPFEGDMFGHRERCVFVWQCQHAPFAI